MDNSLPNLALVIGGAKCIWDDLARFRSLGVEPDVVVAVNDIGAVWPHRLDHWASYHGRKLAGWAQLREKARLPPADNLWTGSARRAKLPSGVKPFNQYGGSSGLLGTMVALNYAYRAVLVGIPLDPEMPHYHNLQKGKPWKDGKNYHKHWIARRLQERVKSMSGFTRELLGEPTKEWLGGGHGGNDSIQRLVVDSDLGGCVVDS